MNLKKTIFISFFLFSSLISFGQINQDSIFVKKALGSVFVQNNKNLTPKQLLEITAINPEAYQFMKKAKKNFDAGAVFGFIGGALIGWPCGTAMAGGDPEWALAAVGGALVGVSIPFSVAYSKNAKKAVDIYNAGLTRPELGYLDFKLSLMPGGVGLKLQF